MIDVAKRLSVVLNVIPLKRQRFTQANPFEVIPIIRDIPYETVKIRFSLCCHRL
ncbi:hypothetical protein FORC54_3897 [Vibrio vulnificus]|nr:hypothetical protein FORC54_3897 [Vibrio vulnificus]